MSKFIWIVLLLMPGSIQAEGFVQAINFDRRESIELATSDDPVLAEKFFDKLLNDPELEKQPLAFVRVVYGLTLILPNYAARPGFLDKLQKAQIMADKLNLQHESIIISFFAQGMTNSDNLQFALIADNKEREQKFKTLMQIASEKKASTAGAFLRLEYASYLRDTGRDTESVSILVEATNLLETDDNDWLKMKLKSSLAQSFSFQGQPNKTKELFAEVDSYCQKVPLDDFCLTNLYNSGKIYVLDDAPDSLKKSESYFERALVLSLRSKNELMEATIRNGLIVLNHKRANFTLAEENGLKAARLFAKLNDPIWEADSYKLLARMYISWQKPAQALEASARSRKLFPKDFSRDLMELDEISYLANKASNQWRESLIALERHVATYKAISSETQDKIYAKTKVNMGLQFEEERNASLTAVNQLQQQQLKDADRLKKLLLLLTCSCAVIAASLLYSLRQARLIRKQKIVMQRILDNIDEGLVTLNSDLKIERLHSTYLSRVFADDSQVSGQSLVQLLRSKGGVNQEQASIIEECLRAAIGEGEFQWEINSGLLPHEVSLSLGGSARVFSIHWQPLYRPDQTCEKILVSLRDISAQKNWERRAKDEETKSLQALQRLQNLAGTKPRRIAELLERLQNCIESLSSNSTDAQNRKKIFQDLHTTKGVARALGFKDISETIHEMENHFTNVHDPQPELYRQSKTQLESLWMSYHQLNQDIFNTSSQNKAPTQNLFEIISAIVPDLAERLRSSGLKLGRVTVEDEVFPWTQDNLSIAQEAVIHGLNNAIDHGYLRPLKHGHKFDHVNLHVKTERVEDGFKILIMDEGAGVDTEELQRKAEQLQFTPEPGGSYIDVVFCSGVTTAQDLSLTSGRGIGLSAVHQRVRDLGGRTRLLPKDKGTILEVFLPTVPEHNAA